MLNDVIGSIQREITELGKATAAGNFDNERKQRLLNHLNDLARSGYPGAEGAANRLRGELEAIQPEYFATVRIDTYEAQVAMAALRHQFNLTESAARNAVAAFGAANAARVTAALNSDFGDITKSFKREFGGRVERNAVYLVGEKRPELFIPDQNGVILPQVPPISNPATLDAASMVGVGTNVDMDRLLSALRDLEDTLTEQLAADGAAVRPEDRVPEDTTSRTVTVEQTITGPLVSIEATFGPGSSAADIIAAMESIADQRLAATLEQVLKDHGAGAGTRL
jgi:hypothetical protein